MACYETCLINDPVGKWLVQLNIVFYSVLRFCLMFMIKPSQCNPEFICSQKRCLIGNSIYIVQVVLIRSSRCVNHILQKFVLKELGE